VRWASWWQVRRLYDICNVLTSLRMIEKVKLPDTSKPAFKWLGVTRETYEVFDATAAAARPVKAYGGGNNAPVCSKRSRNSMGGEGKLKPAKRPSLEPTQPTGAVVHAVPLALMAGTHPQLAYQQTTAATVTACATAPTHEAIARAQANLARINGANTVQASVVCNGMMSPCNGALRKPVLAQAPAPTPAHVQMELAHKGALLANTPRQATAALLTMAAQRVESNEF
jgi:hypothetical protein